MQAGRDAADVDGEVHAPGRVLDEARLADVGARGVAEGGGGVPGGLRARGERRGGGGGRGAGDVLDAAAGEEGRGREEGSGGRAERDAGHGAWGPEVKPAPRSARGRVTTGVPARLE